MHIVVNLKPVRFRVMFVLPSPLVEDLDKEVFLRVQLGQVGLVVYLLVSVGK